ncbi:MULTISPECIES: UDP-glucose 4-epimerase GalE [Acidithiobacillus]|jgi:UDP-glucose-4-epimerase|uniref:UDP-glucose 4-epimerase n=2 Tax=Acidithiobacillus TaxID=119977 RepID=A0A179BKA2_ACIFR|nr:MULTISPECIES: UDP-glucose 4-epimerase GalE [Acidithiobacillus]MBU2833741.1 UDP-glucose 4-epimerase GalE [Acidithiobacillus ferriphilus]MEB8486928.1 UDP-glucose 4-epimerase GalE [Acidithiobacillus ferriphilus]MEB8489729.1 UDP-glucose 4-epimerase GalE [Acidithiobacillus ferriphilus]MEB8493660.1 UDP-glucose 4-epimerase GalE [Acidithiobacillus ferriphilus]MEB8512719.1 UDP-glucose 4-epimerase GalE [Acidithiobacillus ferriphilus]
MKQPILVVGGAGYIGSHMAKMLVQSGHEVLILDNLSTGFREAARYGRLLEGDLADTALLERIFGETPVAAVMHFAALSQVGESIREPARYYRNNVANTQNLLETMLRHNVRRFIFSSTAALFGEPEYTPIDEQHPQRPINPYGRSKRMVEEMLADHDSAYGLRFVSLRYFNAAGADPEGELGERHDPESHLIPLVLQAASSRQAQIAIYGDDYPTPDGTCIRDYVHVWDLCSAHLLALEHLLADRESNTFNLGNGQGFSVQEVIDTARRVTGRGIPADVQPRRPGDPAVLVADSQKARDTLNWKPRFADLTAMMEHAWSWEQQKGTAW